MRQLAALLAIVTASCASPTRPSPADATWLTSTDSGVTYRYVAADQVIAQDIRPTVRSSIGNVTAFLGLPFVSELEVVLYPDRQQFVNRMREIWNFPTSIEPACGAVGTAARTGIYLLSPRVWRTDACGLADTPEIRRGAIAHELVHALHIQQQRAQLPAEAQFVTTPWIIEGLAVYVSGQLEYEFANHARNRFTAGFAPTTFSEVSADSAFFGLAGSLVGYIDATYGRASLRGLVTTRSNSAALAALDTTEEALLRAWRAVVAPPSSSASASIPKCCETCSCDVSTSECCESAS